MAFLEKFRWGMEAMVDLSACQRVAYECVEDACQEGVDYLEIRFSPAFMAEKHHLSWEGVVEAVCDGVESARQGFGIRVNVIGIISRTYGIASAEKEFLALASARERLVALDLAGDEKNGPGELFVGIFQRARDIGWQVTVHAGEICGPESIWQAIDELGATRIGHAVSAQLDPKLMDYMVENRIAVEANLTSNIQTSTVQDYIDHPLAKFLVHGIAASINTDDPSISGITLGHEYNIAAPAAGLDRRQIAQAQQNGLTSSFLPESEKVALLVEKHRQLTEL
jgi:adenosine deaminase